jgi:hypothetical protein
MDEGIGGMKCKVEARNVLECRKRHLRHTWPNSVHDGESPEEVVAVSGESNVRIKRCRV